MGTPADGRACAALERRCDPANDRCSGSRAMWRPWSCSGTTLGRRVVDHLALMGVLTLACLAVVSESGAAAPPRVPSPVPPAPPAAVPVRESRSRPGRTYDVPVLMYHRITC